MILYLNTLVMLIMLFFFKYREREKKSPTLTTPGYGRGTTYLKWMSSPLEGTLQPLPSVPRAFGVMEVGVQGNAMIS